MRHLHRLATPALALLLGAAVAGAPTAPAAAGRPDRLQRDLDTAARAYGVPASVLAAYTYTRTRWETGGGRPSAAGGYGPGDLVDASGMETGGRTGGPHDHTGEAGKEHLDTLGRAARLTGLPRARLMADPAANLRGTAALLADAQRRLHHPVGRTTDPTEWYGAVAALAPSPEAALDSADRTASVLRTGAARTTSSGEHVTATAVPLGSVAGQRAAVARAARRLWPTLPTKDCPATLACEWLPAPYRRLSPDPTDYGNHDIAHRPVTSRITTIVVHDTEGYYANDIAGVRDPSYLGWQYTIRSADGHVAQHLAPRDIGWQAGNWYVNVHSIGVEHEGFAAKGSTWFTDALYRSSATLVRHLALHHDVPLDRAHVIGHDQVPGQLPDSVARMHWDPGPYWDWARYFDLLGAPLRTGTRTPDVRPRVGQVVRVLPRFSTNVQPITGCTSTGVRCPAQGSSIVPVRTAPSSTAPLVGDPGLQGTASATWAVSDWGGKASTGTDYVVAGTSGAWVAIWFAGRVGWIHDPATAPTLRVRTSATVAVPRSAAGAATYGRAYPVPGDYPAGMAPDPVTPLQTRIAGGQAYTVVDAHPPAENWVSRTVDPLTPADHTAVPGSDRYVLVDLGHRLGYVRAVEVSLRTVTG